MYSICGNFVCRYFLYASLSFLQGERDDARNRINERDREGIKTIMNMSKSPQKPQIWSFNNFNNDTIGAKVQHNTHFRVLTVNLKKNS